MAVLTTERLVLRQLEPADAPFIIALLNDPDWIRYIGDRGVRSVQQAVQYIETGPARTFARYGFCLYLVEQTASGEPIGMCGLLKRDALDDPDIGFAFLPQYRGAGYAFEAATGVLRYAASALGLRRVLAIVAMENERSARLLEKLGFRFERVIQYPDENSAVRLFACSLDEPGKPAAETP